MHLRDIYILWVDLVDFTFSSSIDLSLSKPIPHSLFWGVLFLIEGNIICLNVLEVTQVNMPYCTRVYNTHVVSDLTVNFSEIEHWKQPQFRFESLQVYFQLNFLLQIEVCVKLSRYRIQEKQVGMVEVDSTFPIFANSKIFGKKSLSQIWWYYFCVQKWRLQEHFLKGKIF